MVDGASRGLSPRSGWNLAKEESCQPTDHLAEDNGKTVLGMLYTICTPIVTNRTDSAGDHHHNPPSHESGILPLTTAWLLMERRHANQKEKRPDGAMPKSGKPNQSDSGTQSGVTTCHPHPVPSLSPPLLVLDLFRWTVQIDEQQGRAVLCR